MASGNDADVGLRLRLFGRSEVRRDLRDTSDDLDDTGAAAEGLGARALDAAKGLAAMVDEKIEKGLKGIAGAAKTAGAGIATGLAAGIATAGAAVGAALVASVAAGIEQQDVSRSLQASLGLDPDAAAEAGAIAGRIYAQNYGESREQVGAALATLAKTSGLPVTDRQIQDATRSALNLASAFEVDVSESARAAGALVRADLVDTLGEAYALITAGFQRGADRGEDFLDVLTEYATTFATLGISGEQAGGMIVQALDAGVSTADFAADALRETGILIRENSDSSREALQSLGLDADKIGAAFNAGGAQAVDALDTVYTALRETSDEATRNAAGTALIGSQFEDIGVALLAMDPSTAAAGLGDVGDAANNLDAALAGGLGPSLEAAKRSLGGLVSGVGAELVNRWGPGTEGTLDRISGGVNALAGDLPGLTGDLLALVTTGDLTGFGGRVESAFGLAAGSVTRFDENTRAFVTTMRDDVAPVLGAVVEGLTRFAEHKITHLLPIITAALGFLADNADTVSTVVFGGLVVWGLYRTALKVAAGVTAAHTLALRANAAAQAFSRGTIGTWVGVKYLELTAWARSTLAAGRSTVAMGLNRAAYAGQWLAAFTLAKGREAAAWAVSTARTTAGRVAMLAAAGAGLVVRGATVAATAAQWLFNAALTANPIGLVIAGIAALAAGLVWFFTKTETGRKAWGWLTDAFRSGVDWIKNTAVPMFKVGLAAALQVAVEKFTAIRTKVDAFVTAVRTGIRYVGQLADRLTGGLVGDVLGTFGVEIDGRASGGTVRANTPYIVGEEGAELFVPGVTGSILPSDALASLLSTPVPVARASTVPAANLDDDDAGIPDGLATLSLTIPVVVDGREIARATVNGMHSNAAWT